MLLESYRDMERWRPFRRPHFIEGRRQRRRLHRARRGGRFGGRTSLRTRRRVTVEYSLDAVAAVSAAALH